MILRPRLYRFQFLTRALLLIGALAIVMFVLLSQQYQFLVSLGKLSFTSAPSHLVAGWWTIGSWQIAANESTDVHFSFELPRTDSAPNVFLVFIPWWLVVSIPVCAAVPMLYLTRMRVESNSPLGAFPIDVKKTHSV
jgi:hypothetical protein